MVPSVWELLGPIQQPRGEPAERAVMALVADRPLRGLTSLARLQLYVMSAIPLWATGRKGRRRHVVNLALMTWQGGAWKIRREWDAGLAPRPRRPKLAARRLKPGPFGPHGQWKVQGSGKEAVISGPGRWRLLLAIEDGPAIDVPDGPGRLWVRREVQVRMPVLDRRGRPVLVSHGAYLPEDDRQVMEVAELLATHMTRPVPAGALRPYTEVPSDEDRWSLRWGPALQDAMLKGLGVEGDVAVRAAVDGEVACVTVDGEANLATISFASGAWQRVPAGRLLVKPGDAVAVGQPLAEFVPRFVWAENPHEAWLALQAELGPHLYWAAREVVASLAVRHQGRRYAPSALVEGIPSLLDCRREDDLALDGRAIVSGVPYNWRQDVVEWGPFRIPTRTPRLVIPAAVK